MKKSPFTIKSEQKKEQGNREKGPSTENIKNQDLKPYFKNSELKKEYSKQNKQNSNTKEHFKITDTQNDGFKNTTVRNNTDFDFKKDFKYEKSTFQGHTVYKYTETPKISELKYNEKQNEMKKDVGRFSHEKKNESENKNPSLSAAEMWKNAAKLLDSKKTPKKTAHIIETVEKKPDFIHYNENEYPKAFFQSVMNQCTLKKTVKREPKVKVPDFFPKSAIHIFDGPEVYQQLDIDTLFFIFYFSKDERQCFSARELKKYSWRYHTKYNTWFQRLEEPKLITEYYEQGIFLFFDYEVTWTNRKKKDFTFEYKYLENIEM